MAELGAAAIGAGATIGAALYTAASGFSARHENTHSLQVTEIRRHIADFEGAYARGEVAEDDWRTYLAIRNEARTTESDYEESIETYKQTPMYNFVVKWKKRRQVRKKKRALRMANRSLRSHYYESTSSTSDASSIAAESGSPPQSCGSLAYSDEDEERILSWADDVRMSKSQAELDFASLNIDLVPEEDEGEEQRFKSVTVEQDPPLPASGPSVFDIGRHSEVVPSPPTSQAEAKGKVVIVESLRDARSRTERLARIVNQGQQRTEVIKDVRTSETPKKVDASISMGELATMKPSKRRLLPHGEVTAATMRVSQLAEGLPLAPPAWSTRDKRHKVKSRLSVLTNISSRNKSAASPNRQPLIASQRDALVSKSPEYICEVVHECTPPALVSYSLFPFFTLRRGEFYEILQETGHPNVHPGLPLHVENRKECLLLCRDMDGLVGWALASFLKPLSSGP